MFAKRGGKIQGFAEADIFGNSSVNQFVQVFETDLSEHFAHVVGVWADVAADKWVG